MSGRARAGASVVHDGGMEAHIHGGRRAGGRTNVRPSGWAGAPDSSSACSPPLSSSLLSVRLSFHLSLGAFIRPFALLLFRFLRRRREQRKVVDVHVRSAPVTSLAFPPLQW